MTPKERAAMQQALEALEVYGEHAKDCPQYPTYTRPQDYPKCDCGFDQAITALREALDHFRDATKKVAEQAEQEPVAWVVYTEGGDAIDCICSEKPRLNKEQYTIPLYAAPVRTKDLTPQEINKICDDVFAVESSLHDFARAVIAADREKNRG